MPDELKPCPWCGHSAEMEPQGYRNEALVFCPKCARGVIGECGDIDDAIVAWNALSRAQGWTTYNGSFETLPELGVHVLIERGSIVKTVGRRAFSRSDGRSVWSTHTGEYHIWFVRVGDRWMLWPGGNNG